MKVNYPTFRRLRRIDYRLLVPLRAIVVQRVLVEVDNLPDYDKSGYLGSDSNRYFFRYDWSYSHRYAAILDASIEGTRVYSEDDIKRIAKERGAKPGPLKDYAAFLTEVLDPELEGFDHDGWEPKFD